MKKKAWSTHKLCLRCQKTRTKNGYCAVCTKERIRLSRVTAEQYREGARRKYASEGSIEIDDGAPVSTGADDGAYVQAWVWVYAEDCR
jgi:hypothetical protein